MDTQSQEAVINAGRIRGFREEAERIKARETAIVHAETESGIPQSECGKHWKVTWSLTGEVIYQPVYCGDCTGCYERKAANDKLHLQANIMGHLKENPDLKLQYVANVPESEAAAFYKRIQRDESAADYHRSINEDGSCNFFVLAEQESYGDVIERSVELLPNGDLKEAYDLDSTPHDFTEAAKTAKKKGKRQSGGLFKKRKVEKEDTFLIRIPEFTATNPHESQRLRTLAQQVTPLAYATNELEYQQSFYNMSFDLERLATSRNIEVKVSMRLRYASRETLDKFNDRVSANRRSRDLPTWNPMADQECPNKNHILTGQEDMVLIRTQHEAAYEPTDTYNVVDSTFEQLEVAFMAVR